jgi:hypothetical protein
MLIHFPWPRMGENDELWDTPDSLDMQKSCCCRNFFLFVFSCLIYSSTLFSVIKGLLRHAAS